MSPVAKLFDAVKAMRRRQTGKGTAVPQARLGGRLRPDIPKIIWTCWFQGRQNAPPLVKTCLLSWERLNPGWELRCLDATNIEQYISVTQFLDLQTQSLTAASLSDVVRILLLHEFGGVWVDATVFCNRPLDEWLPEAAREGFFAFTALNPARVISSWFLCAAPGHDLAATWCRKTVGYWSNRRDTDDYFWFHHLFRDACKADCRVAEAWSRIPKLGAEKPHALQIGGLMYRPAAAVRDKVDWTTAVFKLTHRLPEGVLQPASLLDYLLRLHDDDAAPAVSAPAEAARRASPRSFASLKVSTENLGDHIQIICGLRMLARLGIKPGRFIDRDHEIRSAPGLDEADGPVGILLNGWFKENRNEWPPHPKLAPLIFAFHARLTHCPELVSPASIAFFRQHQPLGCRDPYTEALLRSKGLDAFTSHCLSLTLPRRIENPATQTEIFVVSRDERIKDRLPSSIGPYTFVCHYSGSTDFAANMAKAEQLLETYRSRAKLIVTTMLHCALPAVAMGIPVVVFYPLNNEKAHASDRERFSSLERLVRVHSFSEIDSVNWNPAPVDVSRVKLEILDRFYEMAARWHIAPPPPLGPIAPPSALPAEPFRWGPL